MSRMNINLFIIKQKLPISNSYLGKIHAVFLCPKAFKGLKGLKDLNLNDRRSTGLNPLHIYGFQVQYI